VDGGFRLGDGDACDRRAEVGAGEGAIEGKEGSVEGDISDVDLVSTRSPKGVISAWASVVPSKKRITHK